MGAKDYLASNDEFTVHIVLLKNGRTVLGVILASALNELYTGIIGAIVWHERQGRILFFRKKKKM